MWIVGVVGEKQTLPVIPPIPASSMSADVDLTKLRSSGYQVSMQGSLLVGNITATAANLPSFHPAGGLFFPRSLHILLTVPTPLLHGTGRSHLYT